MRYLREGLLWIGNAEGACELRDLRSALSHPLAPRAARAASQLMRGLDGDDATSAAAILGEDWTEERDDPFDRVVRGRLARLDAELDWMIPPEAQWLVELCEVAHSTLRQSKGELDQLPVLPETAARRALLLEEIAGAGARVALVGDDDLLAIPAAALGMRPTVLDIDPDLLALYEVIGPKLGLEVTPRQVDLREPLPADLRGRFDAFCTDPENTRECVCLFLSRGVSLVRPGGVGLVAGAEEWADLIANAASGMGLETTRRLRRFAHYRSVAFDLAAYRSDQYVLQVPPGARPLVGPDETFREHLFTFGLVGENHLLVTARGCDPRSLDGQTLIDLVVELSGARPSSAHLVDRNPLPVRLVTCDGDLGQVQITVRADTSTADIDLAPAPDDEARIRRIGERLVEILGARDLKMRALHRLE